MAQLLEPYLKGSEYLVISQGKNRLYEGAHQSANAMDDREPSKMAQPLVIGWPQLEQEITPPSPSTATAMTGSASSTNPSSC